MRRIFAVVSLFAVACGGAVASPEPEPEPEPTSTVVDAGADACAERTVEAWCAVVARGGTNVDPRADGCCTTWISDR